MGDFNSPSHVRGQGFDCVQKSGWKDTYQLAREKDQGFTARGKIDGWRTGDETQSMRIDYIWCSRDLIPRSSRVICNGLQEPVVSDHYGILLEYI